MRNMRLEWCEGPGRFTVATYNEATATFAAMPVAAGLIELASTPDFSLTFVQGELGLKAVSNSLRAEGFIIQGATGDLSSPRIEFWVDNQRVATLTSAGVLICPNMIEQAAVPGAGLFELKLGGVLYATLGRWGLVCP